MDKTLTVVFTVPSCYVIGLSDIGAWAEFDDDGNVIESDDLRLCIDLSGGHKYILQHSQMIQYNDAGNLEVVEYR